MRLLIDACLSRRLVAELTAEGHDAVWVRDWNPSADDIEVVAKAQRERRIIVTLDRDIPGIVLLSGNDSPSVIRLVRLMTSAQARAAATALRRHADDLNSGALVTVSPRLIRTRRLGPQP